MTKVLNLVWMVANILVCPCPFALYFTFLANTGQISGNQYFDKKNWLANILAGRAWAKNKHTVKTDQIKLFLGKLMSPSPDVGCSNRGL